MLLICGVSSVRAQYCYELMDHASGFDVTGFLFEMEEKACEVTDPFIDPAYRDSFKVDSYGFEKDLKFSDEIYLSNGF